MAKITVEEMRFRHMQDQAHASLAEWRDTIERIAGGGFEPTDHDLDCVRKVCMVALADMITREAEVQGLNDE